MSQKTEKLFDVGYSIDDKSKDLVFLPYDKVEFVDTTVCILGWANTNPPSTVIDRHCDRQR